MKNIKSFKKFNESVEEYYKTTFLGETDPIYVIVAEKGDNYVLVAEDKLHLWKESNPIEKGYYYEDVIPKSECEPKFK